MLITLTKQIILIHKANHSYSQFQSWRENLDPI